MAIKELEPISGNVITGNGIMRCYNMFPRQFSDINEMRAYLKKVKEMGFNVVWINPIQQSGQVLLTRMDKNNGVWEKNKVIKSLYAMKDPNVIDSDFSVAPKNSSEEEANKINEAAIKLFTAEAQALGITPIFDLVMNHVSADSPLCDEYPHWFQGIDPSFQDAKKFNYNDKEIKNEIIEKLWKPYIKKYIQEYGFGGMRVDAVGHVDPEVRAAVYEYANQLAKEMSRPEPIIFDEALFSDGELEASIEKLKLSGTGPTHITTGTYYASRDSFSAGLPEWTKNEAGNKARVIFQKSDGSYRESAMGGTVNFTGNHDHNSLAMTVIKELAEKRLAQDPLMSSYCHRVEKYTNWSGKEQLDESRHIKILFPYMQDIIQQLEDNDPEITHEVATEIRDKLMLCALTSSGGWYALCGDEYGDLHAKSVFVRENGGELYPQQQHKIFRTEDKMLKKQIDEILEEMAIELMKQDQVKQSDQVRFSHNGMYGVYQDLKDQPHLQKRLLTPYIENIRNQINAKENTVCQDFNFRICDRDLKVSFESSEYEPNISRSDNQWGGLFDFSSDFNEVNRILAELPKSDKGFWCEVIAIPDKPDLVAVIRKNGLGLDSPTDLIIMNKNPDNLIELTQEDIHQVACEFQKRVIPAENRYMGNELFDKAYNSVINATLHTSTIGIESAFENSPPRKQFAEYKNEINEIKDSKVKVTTIGPSNFANN